MSSEQLIDQFYSELANAELGMSGWEKQFHQSTPTPVSLCREILTQMSISNHTKVMVMCNIEFVICLIKEFDISPENIYFINDAVAGATKPLCFKKRLLLSSLDVPPQNIYNLQHTLNTIGTVSTMKFDTIIGNPPYQHPNSVNDDDKLWHEFVQKMAVEMAPNTELGFIVPVSMMTGPGPEKKFRPLFEKEGIRDVLVAQIHNEKQFDAAVDTCHWVVRKSNEMNNLDKLFVRGSVFGPLNTSILSKVIFEEADHRFKITDGGYQMNGGKRVLITKSQYLQTPPENAEYHTLYIGNGQKVYAEKLGELVSAPKWKLALPRSKAVNENTMFIIPPGEGCDKLHGFIQFDTEEEAKSALTFYNTALMVYCANTYKMTHGKYGSGYKALFNQTHCIINPGMREWDDESVFDFFGITDEEREEILSKTKKK